MTSDEPLMTPPEPKEEFIALDEVVPVVRVRFDHNSPDSRRRSRPASFRKIPRGRNR